MAHRILETGTPHLTAEIREGVAILTLNRPEARNALGETVSPMLRTMLAHCDADPEVRVMLITGAGKAFCSGGDIKGMGQSNARSSKPRDEAVAELIQRQRTLTGTIVASRKPTIAALPGPAVGAGLALALACDIRVAVRSSFIRTAYIRIGLPGDYGIASLLTRAVGPSRARALMLLSEDVYAERCEQIGLVHRVTEDEALFATAFAMATELAARSSLTLGLMKDNLDDALVLDFNQALDREAKRMVDSITSDEFDIALNRER